MNKITQFFSLVLIAVIAIAGFLYFGGQQDIEGLKKSIAPAASLYPETKSISEKLNFINDQSESLNLSEISQGKWVLMYFGYTSCPDVCPIDLSKINLSFQMMENKDKLQVVFISVDPARDIGRLDQFAGSFNSSFLGLTAHNHELETISKSLGVYHQVVEAQKLAQSDHNSHGDNDTDSHGNQEAGSHEHYNIDHTTSFLLFSPDLKLTALLTSPHEPKPIAEALDQIIETLR
ncbi:MAG: SCO family protein [Candidatus Thioglobus autotrophicus]|nr:SCO family protein [Candidatus Thioglobus autotrophicus]